MTPALATELVSGAVTAAVPLLLAGIGEQLSEKSGVLNVGIEGMMLAGAFSGFSVALWSGALWPGFLAGAASGIAVALPMAVLCVWRGLDQVVVGIGLTLGIEGLTALLHRILFSRSYPHLPEAAHWRVPGLADVFVLGPALFDRHPLAYFAVLFCAALAWLYRGTFVGLHLAAAGVQPAGLDAAGVNVIRVRGLAVLGTGALAGLGGAYLSEIGAGVFVPFMTNGAGFIGIVLAMLGRGSPFLVLAGALLFGAALSATTALQVAGIDIPTDLVQMLPFAVVMFSLVAFGRWAALPPALGRPFRRGER